MLDIRRQRLTKPSDQPSQARSSRVLTIEAQRDQTNHRIVQQLGRQHSLIAIRLVVDRPNGERQSVAGGCVFTQVVRPTEP
jgi:hypothetical protein